ncbi:hypothetical protein QQP08_007645, partial [Theobroma cacao]
FFLKNFGLDEDWDSGKRKTLVMQIVLRSCLQRLLTEPPDKFKPIFSRFAFQELLPHPLPLYRLVSFYHAPVLSDLRRQ